MVESAALLVDEVLPAVPIRQWVLSFPYQLRLLLARQPEMMGKVLEIAYRTLATHLIRKAGFNKHSAQTGAVTLIQRFGSALNVNLHFHMLFLDISRPAVSEKRLALTSNGKVCYELKTPYRDGTTHVFFEPLARIFHQTFEIESRKPEVR